MLPFCSWLRHMLLSLSHSLPTSGLVQLLSLSFQSVLAAPEPPAPRFPLLPDFLFTQVHGYSAPGAKRSLSISLLKWTLMLLCFLFVGLPGENKCAVACCPEKRRWVIDSESSLHSRGLARWSCTGELCHCGAPAEQLLYPALLPDCHGLWRFPCPQTVHQECFQFQFVPFIQREADEGAFSVLNQHIRVSGFTSKLHFRASEPSASMPGTTSPCGKRSLSLRARAGKKPFPPFPG